MWDILLPQTELTLNLLLQANLNPSRSVWSYFHGPFNYDATPIGPLGCDIIAHKNTGTRHSWDFRGADGCSVGVELQHYRCHTIVEKANLAAQIANTGEFRHHRLTQPTVTPVDRIFHGVNTLTCVLHEAPTIAGNNQNFQKRRSTTPSNDGPNLHYLHKRSLIVPRFHTISHNIVPYCALCAVPMKTKPQTYLQGWPLQILTPPRYQHRYHLSQVNMNQLRDAQVPMSPKPWTIHLQG